MYKAVDLIEKMVVFEDLESGKKFKFEYISSISGKQAIFCKKGYTTTLDNLKKYGRLIEMKGGN